MWNDWFTFINNLFIPYSGLFPPSHCKCRALFLRLITLSDRQTYTSGRIPLDEWSARRKVFYLHYTKYSREKLPFEPV